MNIGILASQGWPWLNVVRDFVRELPAEASAITCTKQPQIGRATEEICNAIGADYGLRASEDLLFRDCETVVLFTEAGEQQDEYLNYLAALADKHQKPMRVIGV